MLQELTNSLKRRLSPSLKVMFRVGYINEKLERTKDGVHTFLNFLESKYEKEFVAYLKDLEAEKEKETDCGQ